MADNGLYVQHHGRGDEKAATCERARAASAEDSRKLHYASYTITHGGSKYAGLIAVFHRGELRPDLMDDWQVQRYNRLMEAISLA